MQGTVSIDAAEYQAMFMMILIWYWGSFQQPDQEDDKKEQSMVDFNGVMISYH